MTMEPTAEHLNLLADAFFKRLTRRNCEYGGWGLDDKRPFGNSDASYDICDILGLEATEENRSYADDVYSALGKHLQERWAKLRATDIACTFGTVVRAANSAPAIAFGQTAPGFCVFVSAQDNSLGIDRIDKIPFDGDDSKVTLPTLGEVRAALAGFTAKKPR